MLTGVKVYIEKCMCKTEFIRWRKSHKRSRINKKWHKRYGAIYACKGVAYNMKGIGLICCPCFKREMDKQIPVLPVPSMPSIFFSSIY